MPTLLNDLKCLIGQVGDVACGMGGGCCSPQCSPCCIPPPVPVPQVTITCPPPTLVPTCPQYCAPKSNDPNNAQNPTTGPGGEILDERARYDNFYNFYNLDWHAPSAAERERQKQEYESNAGKQRVKPPNPRCEDYTKKPGEAGSAGGGSADSDCCGRGFKTCTMKMIPPKDGCCDPYGIWCAQIQPCKKKSSGAKDAGKYKCKYEPGPCTRPCCLHYTGNEKDGGPCLYDQPCRAHCFNHPPGIKPSGRWP